MFNSKLNGQKLGFNTPLSDLIIQCVYFSIAAMLLALKSYL